MCRLRAIRLPPFSDPSCRFREKRREAAYAVGQAVRSEPGGKVQGFSFQKKAPVITDEGLRTSR